MPTPMVRTNRYVLTKILRTRIVVYFKYDTNLLKSILVNEVSYLATYKVAITLLPKAISNRLQRTAGATLKYQYVIKTHTLANIV